MTDAARHDAWQAGDRYEAYMGRWSRKVAPRFLNWLAAPRGSDWLDVGCGTGALTASILAACDPESVVGVDPSEGFVATARSSVPHARARFLVGDARKLPLAENSCDGAVSALALNFVPDRPAALREMHRVVRSGGFVGFYVWDYPGGGVEFMRAFWTAAVALDPGAADLAEGRRFPFCTPELLTGLVGEAGFSGPQCVAISVPTVFRDFDDYWLPFALGAGPAPGYCAGLAPAHRERLRTLLRQTLPTGADGSIALQARAWAIRAGAS